MVDQKESTGRDTVFIQKVGTAIHLPNNMTTVSEMQRTSPQIFSTDARSPNQNQNLSEFYGHDNKMRVQIGDNYAASAHLHRETRMLHSQPPNFRQSTI